mgnify:CR=1 FL=1
MKAKKKSVCELTFRKDFKRNWGLYLLVLPVLAYYIIFNYVPMYGILIAFKDYKTNLGILGSPFVGLKHFKTFFEYPNFWRLIGNTLRISLSTLIIGMPAPIIFALLLNAFFSEMPKSAFLFNTDAQIGKIADFVFVFIHIP